jgi:hypothetical protein
MTWRSIIVLMYDVVNQRILMNGMKLFYIELHKFIGVLVLLYLR